MYFSYHIAYCISTYSTLDIIHTKIIRRDYLHVMKRSRVYIAISINCKAESWGKIFAFYLFMSSLHNLMDFSICYGKIGECFEWKESFLAIFQINLIIIMFLLLVG